MLENKKQEAAEAFLKLLDIMDELREKCPWDREQTIDSLRPMTIEETYELSDAIMKNDMLNISKELGDILLHIIFYSKIADEKNEFTIIDVIDRLCNKLVYRHPHVFASTQVADAGEVIKNWEQLKRSEKDGNRTVLSGVPVSLPSLIKAYRMQEKAAAVGFDWEERSQVWDKVHEELGEFERELSAMGSAVSEEEKTKASARAECELGDFIFSLVNAARLYGLNPDTALERTNKKFRDRFTYVEMKAGESGRSLKEMSLEEMDGLWNEAKQTE